MFVCLFFPFFFFFFFFFLPSPYSLTLLFLFLNGRYNTIHYSFALIFFTASFFWELCESTATYLWYREDKSNVALRRSVIVKFVLVALHLIVLLIFLFTSTIDNCDYLMSMENYAACPVHHLVAAISQYVVLGFILLYIASLSYKKYEESVLASSSFHDNAVRQKTVAHHHHQTDPEQPASLMSSTISDDAASTKQRGSIDSRASDVSGGIDSLPDTPLFSSNGGRRGSSSSAGTRRKGSLDLHGLPSQAPIPEEGGQYLGPVARPKRAAASPSPAGAPATSSFRSIRSSEYSDGSQENIAMSSMRPGDRRSLDPSAPSLDLSVPTAYPAGRRRSVATSTGRENGSPFDSVKPF